MEDLDKIIEAIEKEIRETPYHKGTERHIARLKSRLVRIREEKYQKAIKASGGHGGSGGFGVKHSGDATVVLVGPPSVGKSSLLNRLTNAESRIGAYDFTTLNVVPGMLKYKGAYLQFFDIPGIIEGAAVGKGRGKEILSIARNADLLILVVDVNKVDEVEPIKLELEKTGIRLDKKPAKVVIKKQSSGGIKIATTAKLDITSETIKELAGEFRLTNAEIIIKESVSLDSLLDAFIGNRVYLPYLVLVNKVDLFESGSRTITLPAGCLPVSAETGYGIDQIKEAIWEKLQLIRIYSKKNGAVDRDKPLIIHSGANLNDVADALKIDRSQREIKSAKISGNGAKYPGQEVSLSFVPVDETVVEFV